MEIAFAGVPGVFIKIAGIDPPYSAAEYTANKKIRESLVLITKVNGNNIANDCALPKPGNAPNNIPKNTPDIIIKTVVIVKILEIKFGKLNNMSISIYQKR
jgi:hypothetical protein